MFVGDWLLGERFGEIEKIHLKRDRETGKSMGYAWIKYEDQRSTILAVDNLVGAKVGPPSLADRAAHMC